MRTLLVTGGAGFIGSNFVQYVLRTQSDVRIINLDKLTYAANPEGIWTEDSRYRFLHGDICDRNTVESIFREYEIETVAHFAAESHVDNSINGPEAFVRTNITGTFALLETARNAWMSAPGVFLPGRERARFLHVSTDEVYGTLGATGAFTEETPYSPNSPYSASKAASDHLVRSYFHTYGLPGIITNCSNNFGPRQHSEKLIPTVIRTALASSPIPVYGEGKNVRDWLFVEDHCSALDLILRTAMPGARYNIGGGNEVENIVLVRKICSILDELKKRPAGSYADQITFVKDRPGHDFRYAIDFSRLQRDLGWTPGGNFDEQLRRTIAWYLGRP